MRHLRILVVDPHPDGADSLATLLGLWGYTARVAACGGEAREEVESLGPDLILTETALADMSGKIQNYVQSIG